MADDRAPIRLRNLQSEVISGTDAATLKAALNAFFNDSTSRGDSTLVLMERVADFKILIVYAE